MTARYIFGGIDGRGNARTGVIFARPAEFAERQHRNNWRSLQIRTDDESRLEVGGIAPHPETGQRVWWGEA